MKPVMMGFNGALSEIFVELEAMTQYPEKTHKKVLRKIGAAVKKQVETEAAKHRSDVDHVHVDQDVTFSIGQTKDTKQPYVSVKGGKMTGYKWAMLNDGFLMRNGKKHDGNQFVDIAEARAAQEVAQIVDAYIREVSEQHG